MKKEFKINYTSISNAEDLNEIEKTLYKNALEARNKAYAPYSHFFVGCALLLENGEIVQGNNQENAAFPSGLCAERTAIFWAAANYPNVKIKKIFVVGSPENGVSKVAIPPCGGCRQSILEYESKQNENIEIYFSSVEGEIIKLNSMKDLLPFSFDASYL